MAKGHHYKVVIAAHLTVALFTVQHGVIFAFIKPIGYLILKY